MTYYDNDRYGNETSSRDERFPGPEDRHQSNGGYYDQRYSRPISLFAWHNIVALVIVGINSGGWLWNLGLDFDGYTSCTTTFSDDFCFDLYFNAFYFAWVIYVVIILVLLIVSLVRANRHVTNNLKRRNIANWATWGTFLLGAGPIVAMAKTSREIILARDRQQGYRF